jgi:Metal binding domain of Ada
MDVDRFGVRERLLAERAESPATRVRFPPDAVPRVCHRGRVLLDSDRSWQAFEAGDPRFDGWVFCGVTTTGIYCRPDRLAA